MKQDSTGGYCVRCDTVWAAPASCKCSVGTIEDRLKTMDMDKFVTSNGSVYDKLVWNAAIETAAKECEEWDKGASPKSDIAPEIRKLKK